MHEKNIPFVRFVCFFLLGLFNGAGDIGRLLVEFLCVLPSLFGVTAGVLLGVALGIICNSCLPKAM